MNVEEQFSNEARIQLSFFSYISFAIWIGTGVGVIYSVSMLLFVQSASSEVMSQNMQILTTFLIYGSVGFLFSLAGAAVTYPIYNYWYGRVRGQHVKGKFAIIKRDL